MRAPIPPSQETKNPSTPANEQAPTSQEARREASVSGVRSLDTLRAEIDHIDQLLLQALGKRMRLSEEVALSKWQSSTPLYDPSREISLEQRLRARAQAEGVPVFLVQRLFRDIMDASLRAQQELLRQRYGTEETQQRTVVAYQGVQGSYSSMAAQAHFAAWPSEVSYVGLHTFADILQAVENKDADFAVLPVENTTAGSINESYDLLADRSLVVVGEEVQRVEHCLLAVRKVPLSDIRRVYSHPQALAQCSQFLERLRGAHVEAYPDTALAAEKIHRDGDPGQAAIASVEAARRYGLAVLQCGIANQSNNFTRMLIVGRAPREYPMAVRKKTSLIFAVGHDHGALLRALQVFATHKLNLSKLESRPQPGSPFQYRFYADFEGDAGQQGVADALHELRAHTTWLKVLGSYPVQTDGTRATFSKSPTAEPG